MTIGKIYFATVTLSSVAHMWPGFTEMEFSQIIS